jgi:hypothetical protein
VAFVPAQLPRARASRGLLAPDAGDPAVEAGQRLAERPDLADRAAEGRVAHPEGVAVGGCLPSEGRPLIDLDLDAVPLLDLAPDVVRLGEEDVRVEGEDPGFRLDREEHVEQHRLLPLERAGERQPRMEVLHHHLEHLGGRQRLRVGGGDERARIGTHPGKDYQPRSEVVMHRISQRRR